ncbi:pleckstrin homology domain-containing family M member 1 isoform X2 [Brienomyrus brachyistius]|uniref:pleckstrin homology domain-containing family M member 1 isoform X2 n=1 Tax=Brienomyrus brachyistius TaxID=42636 RepID=UPI0020B324D9|nr:pleckstrin homology domain-containing family M member 1 isoform X2 [Brienomyrus brachyistius]
MLSTHSPENWPESKEVKQWITSKVALSLKALQKRCVTTDTVVTSEDADANLLCCALEAVFVHGIKSKYIRAEASGRSRMPSTRGPLPQPVFWTLLKTVTHRDVILELEQLSFINSDVGRCRAWVRLALNDGLLECYLASLLREDSKLASYYQPSALLLDPEEREVLLSYLQGLTSLSFQLSYKSAVLNEWTITPLALAGLCPAISEPQDTPQTPPSTGVAPLQAQVRKESWDTASQSSGGSDAVEVQQGLGHRRGVGSRGQLTSSSLSLDTMGSSQLSSSLSSDSLLQGNGHKSPSKEAWPTDLERAAPGEEHGKDQQPMSPLEYEDGVRSSQDSTQEDSCLSSLAPDHLSEAATSSGSDVEMPIAAPSTPEPSVLTQDEEAPGEEMSAAAPAVPSDPPDTEELASPLVSEVSPEPTPDGSACSQEPVGSSSAREDLGRKASVASLHSPTTGQPKWSWISEDDFYKPRPQDGIECDGAPCTDTDLPNGTLMPPTPVEAEPAQSPPSVVHRRQIGLSNPFRGLLKLGHLERRGAVGLWRTYYCELSPFELRFYLDAEERACYDNCSLLRCEDVCVATADGRFELAFPGKRLLLRAPSHDEAEDWVDRIVEAVAKCRPPRCDEQRQSPEAISPQDIEAPVSSPPVLSDASPEEPELDWMRPTELEPEAIKEAVLYLSQDDRSWMPFIFSLSLEALKVFQVQEGHKALRFTHAIESIRDVVPDTSLGSPAYFRLLTARNTLKLRAETEEEAHSWRELIRVALNSYLETCDGSTAASTPTGSGNVHRLVEHSLREDGGLLAHLYSVPTEKGLDVQNFRCAGCSRQIGFSLGKARLCEFSGQYYCESCHHGDAAVIPSRMVHNWDLAVREVSCPALRLLATVSLEPLLDLGVLNPGLYVHAEPMARAHSLRQRLRLLGDYLLTCRSDVIKRIHPKLEERNYLLETSQLYSVTDLRQIADGQYEAFLQNLVQFASSHIYQCDLCTQKGFICQICNAGGIIFPFEFETTTRCKVCKTVSHTACKTQSPSCPRCLRLQKYLEREMED